MRLCRYGKRIHSSTTRRKLANARGSEASKPRAASARAMERVSRSSTCASPLNATFSDSKSLEPSSMTSRCEAVNLLFFAMGRSKSFMDAERLSGRSSKAMGAISWTRDREIGLKGRDQSCHGHSIDESPFSGTVLRQQRCFEVVKSERLSDWLWNPAEPHDSRSRNLQICTLFFQSSGARLYLQSHISTWLKQ